jgi:hypothetical protein
VVRALDLEQDRLSDDEANPVKTQVLVNAIDGTIFKAGKESRRMRNPEQR